MTEKAIATHARKPKRTEPLPEPPDYEQFPGQARVIADPRLNLAAKALYVQIGAFGFYRVEAMLKVNQDGLTALRRSFKQLEAFGYVRRWREHMPQGGFEWKVELLDGTQTRNES